MIRAVESRGPVDTDSMSAGKPTWSPPSLGVDVEAKRLAALRSYAVLDTPSETEFDAVVQLASQICGTAMSLISLVDENRQWFKARHGIGIAETERDLAFCAHVIAQDELFVVEDALSDPRFQDHPFVVGSPRVRFYAGMPLRPSGHNIGTLCVIDSSPAAFGVEKRAALTILARQVEALLELRLKLREVAAMGVELARQRDQLALVEQQKRDLVMHVVHDIKSPLTCIMAEASFLAVTELASDEQESVSVISDAATNIHRMTMNLLDISRGDDGALPITRAEVDVQKVVANARRNALHRAAQSGIEILQIDALADVHLNADGDLLRRVIENLIDNAIKYGRRTPIELETIITDHAVDVRVCDRGPGIPAELRERVFEKYGQLDSEAKGVDRSSRGLGLTFCRLAVEAHGGRIWVEDNAPSGCAFRFRLPR